MIKPQFNTALPFSEGLAAANIYAQGGWMWGFINHEGDVVIQSQWPKVGRFSKGLASVGLGGKVAPAKWGWIDHSGSYVWEPTE